MANPPPACTYRNSTAYPFCPGCGHKPILDRLDAALVKVGIDPASVVLVSDIGCSGLSDQYFATSAFHGLHGRSITYATGIKLARPDLTVIVLMGDGGTGIGGAHLLGAARRNIGLTVLVFNNFNYGMTGGQHSSTTPAGAVTSTTPGGNLERPLDVCATVGVNGAGYVWRGTSFDPDLDDRIAEGIGSGGFALLDIWELCTAWFVPSNHFGRRDLEATLKGLGFGTGVLFRRDLPEYARALRAAGEAERGRAPKRAPALDAVFRSPLSRPFHLLVAGSAGGRVRSATRLLAEAAVRSGLFAAQRDDYPVTVKTGHSLSHLALSPEPVECTAADHPDAVVLLTAEGAGKVKGALRSLPPEARVFASPECAGVATPARVETVDVSAAAVRVPRGSAALATLASVVRRLGVLGEESLRAAAGSGSHAAEDLAAVEAGWGIGGTC